MSRPFSFHRLNDKTELCKYSSDFRFNPPRQAVAILVDIQYLYAWLSLCSLQGLIKQPVVSLFVEILKTNTQVVNTCIKI